MDMLLQSIPSAQYSSRSAIVSPFSHRYFYPKQQSSTAQDFRDAECETDVQQKTNPTRQRDYSEQGQLVSRDYRGWMGCPDEERIGL
jgi:hypothetical protein